MKLNYRYTILAGLAFLTISAFNYFYDFIVPLILHNRFGVDHTTSGFIMSIDNIIALFLIPLFGAISDKTSTRSGRRMPFIIFGTIAAVVFMMAMPLATHLGNIVFFMVGLGLLLIAMAVYRSPAVALMPDITPKPLRSMGNAVINLMGALGSALILGILTFIAPDTKDPNANYWPVFIVIASIMIIGTAALRLTINEPKLVKKMRKDSAAMGIDVEEAKEDTPLAPKKEKLAPEFRRSMALILISISLWFMGYNAVTTAFSKYAVNALGMETGTAALILMVATVGAIIAFLPVGIISTKIGRKKSILFGVVLLAAVFGTASLYTAFSPLMYVSFGLAGVAWACINVNSLPMVLEMSKGASVGRYTGYYYTFSMAAQIVTPILSGVLLDQVGYNTLLPYGAFFVVLSFFTMLTVKHGDSRPQLPTSKLEAFDVAD